MTRIETAMTFKMKDAAGLLGVSTRTLVRWFKEGKIEEVDRDRNNHRIFEHEDIERIKAFVNRRVAAPGKIQPMLFDQKYMLTATGKNSQ